MDYGLYILGAGLVVAVAGSLTQTDWLAGIGAIAMFAGFVAWRKSLKKEKK
jgi:general stress protein CsbA